MEWRIREEGRGGYSAEYGVQHSGGVTNWNGIGCTMPAFIVYKAAHFETYTQAKNYIKRQTLKR